MRFRFGLRAFFVLVTFLCLWLGFVVHRAEQQRRAVQAIEAMGGTTWYDDDTFIDVILGRRLKPTRSSERTDRFTRHYLHTVTEVSLDFTPSTDETMMQLAPLSSIETLAICGTHITDKGMQAVDDLSKLRSLSLGNTQITDAGLAYLQDAYKLEALLLSQTAITDAGLQYIRRLPKLRMVSLRKTKVTQTGVDALISASPSLKRIGVFVDNKLQVDHHRK